MIYYMSARVRECGCSYYTHTLLIRREVTHNTTHIDTLSPLTQCDCTDRDTDIDRDSSMCRVIQLLFLYIIINLVISLHAITTAQVGHIFTYCI